MNKESYFEQRNALYAEAEAMIAENKTEEANAKMSEIETLDNKWEESKLAMANLNALKDNAVIINLENKSLEIEGGKQMEVLNKRVEDVQTTEEYKNAFMKKLMGKDLTAQENTMVSGAAVIPTQTMDAIIEKLEQTSVLYPFISKSQIPGNLSLPVENAKERCCMGSNGNSSN